MLAVSDDFKTAIAASKRKILGKVVISYSDPFLDSSVGVTANENAYISHISQAADGIDTTTHKWVSCDGSCKPDGTYYPCPTKDADLGHNQMGWWGNSISDVNGDFSKPYPTLTIEFSARNIERIIIGGDSARGEYPQDFTLNFYDAANKLLLADSISGNTLINWVKSGYRLTGVTKISLVITKWSHGGRQAKIAEIFTILQQTYLGYDLFLIDLLEEREFSTGTLPIGNISSNELTVRMSNVDRRFDPGNTDSKLYGLVQPNRKVQAWIGIEVSGGSIEWVPLGTFFCGEWSAPEDDIYAETTAKDRLDLLARATFSGPVYQNISLYQLAVNVLSSTGYQYWIDTELQNYIIPYAYFDSLTCRECLRLIAEASLSQVYVSRDDVIRVEGPSFLASKSTICHDISTDNYLTKDNPANYSEIANYVKLITQPLTPVEKAKEVYKSDEAESIRAGETKTITVTYSSKPVIEAVATLTDATAATITDVTYYAWGADITVHSLTADTFTIVVTGKPLSVMNSKEIVAKDTSSIKRFGKMMYEFSDNPLIQTATMGQAIADKCLELSKDARNDLDMEWQGNPALELGDIIQTPDSKTKALFYVISQNFEWDGGLTCTIKGKKAVIHEKRGEIVI